MRACDSISHSVGRSVCWLVCQSVDLSVAEGSEHATYGDRPCYIEKRNIKGKSKLIIDRENLMEPKTYLGNNRNEKELIEHGRTNNCYQFHSNLAIVSK